MASPKERASETYQVRLTENARQDFDYITGITAGLVVFLCFNIVCPTGRQTIDFFKFILELALLRILKFTFGFDLLIQITVGGLDKKPAWRQTGMTKNKPAGHCLGEQRPKMRELMEDFWEP